MEGERLVRPGHGGSVYTPVVSRPADVHDWCGAELSLGRIPEHVIYYIMSLFRGHYLGTVYILPRAPMATSGGRMTGLAYVPPIDPILLSEKVPPDRS